MVKYLCPATTFPILYSRAVLNVQSIFIDATNGVVQSEPASPGTFIDVGTTYTGSNSAYFTLTSTNNLIDITDGSPQPFTVEAQSN